MELSLPPVAPGGPAPLLFAVFDGHGGSEVATFAARHMVRSPLTLQHSYGYDAVQCFGVHDMDHKRKVEAMLQTGNRGRVFNRAIG